MDIDLGEDSKKASHQEKKEEIEFDDLKEKEIDKEIVDSSVEEVDESDEEYKVSDEVIDMESMLFEKADIKLKKNKKVEKENKEESRNRKVDLEKVSNLFIELPVKNNKESDEIKVPNYIKDLIENFFQGLNSQKLTQNEFGSMQRKQDITLEIIDVNNGDKYRDNLASITEVQGKTYISFNTEKLKDIYYEEKDLARIIKLSNTTYHIEIIPKTTEEYNVWKKLCTTPMRGTTRCYGIM